VRTDNASVTRPQAVVLGIIVPFYNEGPVLPILVRELKRILSAEALQAANVRAVQYLFVDDGSDDDGAVLLEAEIRSGGLPGSLLRLSRNFGHQAAIAAGIDHVEGDVVAILDADLQDDPAEIFAMLAAWRRGFDVIYGVRSTRQEHALKRGAYDLFYSVLHFLSEGLIPKHSGDFGLVDRKVALAVRSMGEKIRFFRGLRAWVGFSQTEHLCDRSRRAGGVPKYTFRKLYSLATDGIISSSIRPLKMAEVGSILALLAAAAGSIAVGYRMWRLPDPGGSLFFDHLILLGVLLLGCANLACLYVMSAYIGRMFIEVKGRPPYIVARRVDS
jgi:glycosyltransferase involved in cell wall biosynthesis